jgi:hypothetical protein
VREEGGKEVELLRGRKGSGAAPRYSAGTGGGVDVLEPLGALQIGPYSYFLVYFLILKTYARFRI